MARGAASKIKTMLALLGIIAVPVTYGLVTGWNPLPNWRTWLDKVHLHAPALSSPPPPWTVSLNDQPSASAVADGIAVFVQDSAVEGRSAATGAVQWTKPADWGAIAGSIQTGGTVVVVGRRGHGYQVVTPATGAVRWSSPDGLGVWTYSDLIVQVACAQAFSCELTARSPQDGGVRWHATLPGNGRNFAGANKAQAALRAMAPVPGNGAASQPSRAPPLFAFPIDNQIFVYSGETGHRLHTYKTSGETRFSVAGDLVLASTGKYKGGNCHYTLTARDPDGDHQVWRRDGYDARTSGGLGCEQRRDPVGHAGLVDAVDPDGNDALLDTDTGTVIYQAPGGSTIVDTDGQLALLRSGDKKIVSMVRLAGGAVQWSRSASKGVKVGIEPGGIVVYQDADLGKLTVLGVDTGRVVLDVRSSADILGYAPGLIVINIGRSVGLLTYAAAA